MSLSVDVHPVHSMLARLEAVLGELGQTNPVYLPTDDKATVLIRLEQAQARLSAVRLQVIAVADDVAEASGHRDVGAWLGEHTRAEPRATHSEKQFARELVGWEQVAAAMTAGAVSQAQARVVIGMLGQLPKEVGVDQIHAAETWLVAQCASFRPSELRRLGRHLLDVIAPDIAEEAEARRLLAEEADAATRTTLSIRPMGDGTTRVSGLVPDAVGIRLRTTLEAWAQPRKTALEADGRRAPYTRLMGEALGQLLESLDADRVPAHGGDATTVIVTVSLDNLRRELATATVAGSEICDLSAGEARRLACTGGIIPAVLDGAGQVLDLGRTQRLFSTAQRKALKLRESHCQAEGCTVPATWCDAHHTDPWSRGGRTDLGNAVLLCGHHHRRAHDPTYAHTRLADGSIRYYRRT